MHDRLGRVRPLPWSPTANSDFLTDLDWRKLLREIHNRQVVPVVGPELATIRDPATGEDVALTRALAPRRADRTADHRDFVSGIVVDDARSRWGLTSRGRLFVFDLASGSTLATLETYFYRAAPVQDTPFSGLTIQSGTGDVEFWAYGDSCPEERQLHTVVSVQDVGREGPARRADSTTTRF